MGLGHLTQMPDSQLHGCQLPFPTLPPRPTCPELFRSESASISGASPNRNSHPSSKGRPVSATHPKPSNQSEEVVVGLQSRCGIFQVENVRNSRGLMTTEDLIVNFADGKRPFAFWQWQERLAIVRASSIRSLLFGQTFCAPRLPKKQTNAHSQTFQTEV